jgi:fimbrial isopeptide formation D2 family protein/LPXTG-motif cell wall-anchored protein
MDINDSTGVKEGWQDSADYDIGDKVSFQLTAEITSKYGDYDKYYLVFHDKGSVGLTFDKDSVVVKIDNQVITEDYEVVTNASGEVLDDGDAFEVVFKDLKATSAHAGSEITVEYEATLNDDAILGSDGNSNTLQVEYSNNPNETGDGERSTGKTPEDKVIVFTYKVEINKVDENNKALGGAEFTLYKKDASVKSSELPKEGYKEINGSVYKILKPYNFTSGDTTFTFKGIDDGDYILSETKTPDGYNSISDIAFSVSATHDKTEDNPQLTDLSGDKQTGSAVFSSSKEDGAVKTTVENKSGSSLPSTGGTGRVLLYVVGAILVAGVGVILVSKKRAQQ